MRKLFLFATVAAAGLFASCSSTDDAISDAGNSGVENVDGDKTAIKIGIGNLVNTEETRGTGTVGGVGTGGTNAWYGQRINVFMFKKGTLDYATELVNNVNTNMYANRVLITPGTMENLVESPRYQTAQEEGEAMNADGSIKYYPVNGNFDFFGYHLDDAVDPEAKAPATEEAIVIDKATDGVWKVPFIINGSQDLMSTKAALTGDIDDATTPSQKYTMSQATRSEDYYSAYSARRGVHPTLTFDHLLTRLAFSIKPGNNEASGYGKEFVITHYVIRHITPAEYSALSADGKTYFSGDDTDGYNPVTSPVDAAAFAALPTDVKVFATPSAYADGQNDERAVYVESIRVKSKTTGKLLVAWTAPTMAAYQKVEWATDPVEKFLSLKERAAYKKNEAAEVTAADTDLGTRAAIEALKTTAQGELSDLNDEKDALDGELATLNATKTTLANDLTALNATKTTLADELAALEAELLALQNTDPQDDAAILAKQGEIAAKQTEISTNATDITNKQAEIDANATDITNKQAEIDAKVLLIAAKQAEIDEIDARLENYDTELRILTAQTISAASYARLNDGGKAKYTALTDDEKINADMVPLTPARPEATTNSPFAASTKSIGEALIVAPNDYDGTNYDPKNMKMEVYLSQMVPTNWHWPYNLEKKTMSYELDIPYPTGNDTGDGAFKINNSYNVILTVYGFSRIDVNTVVNKWNDGGEIGVGQD